MSMMKRQKTKRILKYTLCFAAGAVMIFGAIRFLCDFPIVKVDPELIEAKRVYRYEFDDCELPNCQGVNSLFNCDRGVFIYCTMPSTTAASARSMKISRENGNVEMTFYRPIINTAARYYDDDRIYGDIYTIPLEAGDRSLSINGKVVWQEGDADGEELPPYVEAYHVFEYGSGQNSWMTDDTEGSETFTFYNDGHITEWDIEGKVVRKETYSDSEQ